MKHGSQIKMSKLGCWLTFSFFFAIECATIPEFNFDNPINDPDLNKNVSQLITSKGYPVEEHNVVTKDGYILGVQRIKHGKKGQGLKTGEKEVVLLHHGLTSASNDFVINFENQSLGFILADAGYEVWLGNARGNTYSRRHQTLSPKDKKFWNFSWDDIALSDLPATIDYILNLTGQKQLHYVGHSMGTTIAFALLSDSPEYNEKVKSVMALAPVATVTYMNSPIKYLVPYAHDVEMLLHLFGEYEFLPNNMVIKALADIVCGTKRMLPVCQNIVFLADGAEVNQLNVSRVVVYLHHTPAGTSTPTVVQYAQGAIANKFQKYDFGEKENMIKYGQATPPEYQIEKITTPIALFWSLNDQLADPTDVALLRPRIKNLLDFYQVPFPQWTHLDFAIAVYAKEYLYDHLLSLLLKA